MEVEVAGPGLSSIRGCRQERSHVIARTLCNWPQVPAQSHHLLHWRDCIPISFCLLVSYFPGPFASRSAILSTTLDTMIFTVVALL